MPEWIAISSPSLAIALQPDLRGLFVTWLRLYGETNGILGLGSGSLEARLRHLRRLLGEEDVLIWTTPSDWAAGKGLTLRFPLLGLDLSLALEGASLVGRSLTLTPPNAADPRAEPGSVGALVSVHEIRTSAAGDVRGTVGTQLERHFERQAKDRWSGFAEVFCRAIEAEAAAEALRAQRLTLTFDRAEPLRGTPSWALSGIGVISSEIETGDWLDVLTPDGGLVTQARLLASRPHDRTIHLDVVGADPPASGLVRPRARDRILQQKRAVLRQIESPTGDLATLLSLLAAPDLAVVPRPRPPARFFNPLVASSPAQARAVALALGLEEGQTLLIQGPPGTGKSTTTAEIVLQLLAADPSARILVCSHSNHGTDNVLTKVVPFLDDPRRTLVRVGSLERVVPDARPWFANDRRSNGRRLVFATVDALALQDLAGARLYDYVVLDEANRADILDSLLALARGGRRVLVGDQMQLRPVLSEAARHLTANGQIRLASASSNGAATPSLDNTGHGILGTSLFAWLLERGFPPEATVLLDQQQRMHPVIADLVSRRFYEQRLRSGPGAPREPLLVAGISSSVVWVDTRGLTGIAESRNGTSLGNVAEARCAAELASYLAASLPPGLSIGVITAYAEQRNLLRGLLADEPWTADRQLEIDTVDAFEGREKDVVILSLVRSNRRGEVGFLRFEQRLNVAVSRARRLLLIVGDASTLSEGAVGALLETVREIASVVPASDLLALVRATRLYYGQDDRSQKGTAGG